MSIKALLLLSISMVPLAYPQGAYELPDGTFLDGVESMKGVLPRGSLTILGLTLDSSSFKEVRSVMGRTTKLPRTNDPHEADMICYTSIEDPSIHVSFSAGGPENPTDKLTSFMISRGEFKHRGKCAPSKSLTPSTGTANGFHLGLTQDELKSILDRPSKITEKWMVYSYESYRDYTTDEQRKMPRAPGGGYYKGEWTYHYLDARFSDGKMDLLDVSVGGEPTWE